MALRRYFRFGMRTLLIAATLLCLALGLVVVPARRQRQAVLELKAHASIMYEGDREPDGPITWSQTWLGCDFGRRVRLIIISGHRTFQTYEQIETHTYVSGATTAIPEQDWQRILVCQPQHLRISVDYGVDRDLERMKGLRSLCWLAIEDSLLTEKSVKHLAELRHLRELRLEKVNITDAELAQMAALPALQKLTLEGTPNITAEGVAKLQAALPNCNIYRDTLDKNAHFSHPAP